VDGRDDPRVAAALDRFARGEGELLAATRRSRVRRVPFDPAGDAVVKEVHSRRGLPGVRERLRRLVGRTRARAAVAAAERLGALGVATAEPLGLVEEGGRSLVLFRHVAGRPLPAHLAELGPPARRDLGEALGRLAARLHAGGVTHGDLKPENVLVAGGELVLIDLDRARFAAGDPPLARRARDLAALDAGGQRPAPRAPRRVRLAALAGYADARAEERPARLALLRAVAARSLRQQRAWGRR